MNFVVTPTESQSLAALRAFLLAVLPDGNEVIKSQENKVPEPATPNFVLMTPTLMPRLATNVDSYADAVFTGSIAGDILTITAVQRGALEVGSKLFGTGIDSTTMIEGFDSGTGGTGTYVVTPAQTVASRTIAAGVKSLTQKFEWMVQLDVHGPNSANNAALIATTFRDEFATQFFTDIDTAIAPAGLISPLYADDPRQGPFINDENQYENRWIVQATLQIDQTVTIPLQFASGLTIEAVSVQERYPPT